MSRLLLTFIFEGGSFTKRFIGFLLQRSCENDEMWFVSCLFTCSILFYLLVKSSEIISSGWKNYFLIGMSFIFMLLGMADIMIWRIKLIWETEIACIMLLYMTLGYLFRKYEDILEKYTSSLLLGGLTGIYLLLILLIPSDTDIHAERFSHPVIFLISSMIILLPVLHLSKYMCQFQWNKYFTFLGKNTLFYYAFSGIVRILFYNVLQRYGISDIYIQPLFCVLLSAVLLAWPAWFIRRFFPWVVGA